MFELYHSPISTCSQKVRLCMAEKGLGYVDRRIDLMRGEQLSAEYLQINPNGVVPSLVHDGQRIIDSSVICEYLEEVVPEPALMPRNSVERAKVRAWMRYIEEVPTAAIRLPSFNRMLPPGMRDLSPDAKAALSGRRPLRKQLFEKFLSAEDNERENAHSLERLQQTLQRAEKALGEDFWLAGPAFTLADILLTPTIVRMDDIGLAEQWTDRPAVKNWYDRIRARPSFEVAYFPGSRPSSWAA